KVWSGQRVADEETNPLVGLLRLSGIARVGQGYLLVRNRIYGRVFDRGWVRLHMPDAEQRRQRSAYRRGVVRTLVVSASIVAIMGLLAISAARNARQAQVNARNAQVRERAANRALYAADMNLAYQALLDLPNLSRALALLEAHRPGAGQPEDLRGFEWRYL